MTGVFQPNVFQNNVFQVGPVGGSAGVATGTATATGRSGSIGTAAGVATAIGYSINITYAFAVGTAIATAGAIAKALAVNATTRLISFYNENDYDPQTNPGGFDAGGHRYNFIPFLKDIGEVGENRLGSNATTVRLRTFYNRGDYNSVSNPGGFGNGGHRYNYINALRDVADVAMDMGLTSDAIARLDSYYTATTYNVNTNPGGMARGGHRINFNPPSLDDCIIVGRQIGNQGLGISARITWLEIELVQ